MAERTGTGEPPQVVGWHVWLLRQRLVGSDGAGNEAARADVMGG